MRSPLPITGYSLCNALGTGRAAVRDALEAGRTGLGPSPIDVHFPSAVGAMPVELPALGGAAREWSTRIAKMAGLLTAELDPALERARAHWRPERIAIVLGTSTAGAASTELAYGYFVDKGVMPDDYDFRRQHTYGALLNVVRALTGATGPAWVVSTACTSSAKTLASAAAHRGRHGRRGHHRRHRHPVRDDADGVSRAGRPVRRRLPALRRGARRHQHRRGRRVLAHRAARRRGGAALWRWRAPDAYHISAPHPDGHGATSAMQQSLAQPG
ncbi:MAG: beta-ketoacyl synthase N-terminal-like domain-containing protein [Myxococcota bacterium]